MSTHNIPFLNIKKKIILNYPESATMEFVPRDPRPSWNNRGKRAISVRAIEILLYLIHACLENSTCYYVYICSFIISSAVFKENIEVLS